MLSLPTQPMCAWQDTGDTRETPAIDVCKGLMADGAKLVIYDPKVTDAQINHDLATPKFEWDHPESSGSMYQRDSQVPVVEDAYKARALLKACRSCMRMSPEGSTLVQGPFLQAACCPLTIAHLLSRVQSTPLCSEQS